jgi:hypothetical protein
VSYGQLCAWQSHAPRWRAQLADPTYVAPVRRKPVPQAQFIQVKVVSAPQPAPLANLATQANVSPSVRIDCSQGERRVVLHWPRSSLSSLMTICRCFARKKSTAARASLCPRSSMAGWIGQCDVRLAPLRQALCQHLLAQRVLHSEETPVKLLQPGLGKTHLAYLWAWRASDFCTTQWGVVCDFAQSRAGEHARRMLQGFQGTSVGDDYSGCKALFRRGKVQEVGCWAHTRRKFFEAHKLNRRKIAKLALDWIAKL